MDMGMDIEPKLKSSYGMTTDLVLIFIAITVPIFFWVYIPFGGHSHWFGRSGAIIAIIGLVLESRLFIGKVLIFELSQLPVERRKNVTYRYVMGKFIAIMSHFILVSSAVISGYGDLIFEKFKL